MKFIHAVIVFAFVIALGAAITKFTVWDQIVLSQAERECKRIDSWILYDHPFERVAIGLLGKFVAANKSDNKLYLEAYTIFRIPVGKSVIGCGGMSSYKIPTTEKGVKQSIEKARYCEAKADCAQVQSKCPFGCGIFVNKNEAERINTIIDAYESRCIYQCVIVKGYDCINNKCQLLTVIF